eukprot:jgi/Psemu1/313225/fgenesh1_kg.1127_\
MAALAQDLHNHRITLANPLKEQQERRPLLRGKSQNQSQNALHPLIKKKKKQQCQKS